MKIFQSCRISQKAWFIDFLKAYIDKKRPKDFKTRFLLSFFEKLALYIFTLTHISLLTNKMIYSSS